MKNKFIVPTTTFIIGLGFGLSLSPLTQLTSFGTDETQIEPFTANADVFSRESQPVDPYWDFTYPEKTNEIEPIVEPDLETNNVETTRKDTISKAGEICPKGSEHVGVKPEWFTDNRSGPYQQFAWYTHQLLDMKDYVDDISKDKSKCGCLGSYVGLGDVYNEKQVAWVESQSDKIDTITYKLKQAMGELSQIVIEHCGLE